MVSFACGLGLVSVTMMAGAQPSTTPPTYVTITPTLSSFTPTSSAILSTSTPTSTTTAPSGRAISVTPSRAQTFSPTVAPTHTLSNFSSSFVLAFMRNSGGGRRITLFITGEAAATGTVRVPGIAFFADFVVTPGDVTSVDLPPSVVVRNNNVVENLGIRIDATSEIVVYGLNENSVTAGAYLGLPTNVLGTNYIVLGYTALGTGIARASGFLVVAGADDTVVTITLTLSTADRVQGMPYNISLDALDTYQLLAGTTGDDLSGTVITSTKPVAVFGGGSLVEIPLSPRILGFDHVVEQLPPTDTWGTTFLTVPVAHRVAGDIFRILARDSNTDVLIDGVVVATLDATAFFETLLSSFTVHEIVTTKPCLVAQYSQGELVDESDADPFEMLIPAIGQFLDSYTVKTPPTGGAMDFYRSFVNVIVLTTDLDACQINGQPFSSVFTDLGALVIGTSGFTGAQLELGINFEPSVHNLDCPSPFGALVYGLGEAIGFGYPGGIALRPRAP